MFSLNPVTEKCIIKRARSCHFVCKRLECYHNTRETHVRDRIFKLSPIHASHAAGTSINFAFGEEIIDSDIPFITVVYEKIFG